MVFSRGLGRQSAHRAGAMRGAKSLVFSQSCSAWPWQDDVQETRRGDEHRVGGHRRMFGLATGGLHLHASYRTHTTFLETELLSVSSRTMYTPAPTAVPALSRPSQDIDPSPGVGAPVRMRTTNRPARS